MTTQLSVSCSLCGMFKCRDKVHCGHVGMLTSTSSSKRLTEPTAWLQTLVIELLSFGQ